MGQEYAKQFMEKNFPVGCFGNTNKWCENFGVTTTYFHKPELRSMGAGGLSRFIEEGEKISGLLTSTKDTAGKKAEVVRVYGITLEKEKGRRRLNEMSDVGKSKKASVAALTRRRRLASSGRPIHRLA